MVEREEKVKSLLMRVKEESEKAGLQLNIKKKRRSLHLVPSLHLIEEVKWKQLHILSSSAPKSLHTVTAPMKLKDTCSLEENQ